MAELKNQQEPPLPSKRKPEDTEDPPKKSPKLATLDHNEAEEPNPISSNNDNSEKTESDVANNDNELQNDDVDDEDVDDDEDDDDDEEDEDEEDEVDRKGKSVVRDDKGKGKMIEEEDDNDDDDSDDDDDSGGNVSGSESDFSDDPLAEVDLNNILPSRTRRRTAHPGVHIASDTVNAGKDDGDSDDSDA